MNAAEELIEKAKQVVITKTDAEAQRRGFAYGNAKTENDRVTREMVDQAAAKHPRN